jgi:hypothetical protein
MATMTVKRVGVLSVAKMQAMIGVGVGLIIGIIYGLLLMVFGAAMLSTGESGAGGAAAGGFIIGILFMIGFPIFYGIVSFIAGAIGGLIYNVAAKFAGGIELELEGAQPQYGNVQYQPPPPPPPPQYRNY